MRSALSAFQAGIGDLRWYVELVELEGKLVAAATANPPCSADDELAAKLQSHVGLGVAKRRFDYTSVIVSLYGLLEQYIEALVRSYSGRLNKLVPQYTEMPEAVQNTHVALSFKLVEKAEQTRFRGSVTPKELIANLHSCMSNHKRYRLNTEAFCFHTVNFRADAIDEIFGRVGIKSVTTRLHWFSPFLEYIAKEYPNENPAAIKPDRKFEHLNDLAERRNEVAHGNVAQTLSMPILCEYIDFIDIVCTALCALIESHYFGYVAKYAAKQATKVLNVINNQIVCVEVCDMDFAVGDMMIAATGLDYRPYLAGEILEIEVNKVRMQNIKATDAINVGIKVGFRCSTKCEYFVAKRDWLV